MIKGQDSQRGYVCSTKVNCHLKVMDTNVLTVIPNVDSKLLEPVMYWDPEPGNVTLDSWVGKIEFTNEEITLYVGDGAECIVDDDEFSNNLYDFEDVKDERCKDSEFYAKDYYEGQELKGELGLLEDAKWIKSTAQFSKAQARKHPKKIVTVRVKKVEPKSIDVNWLCRGYATVEKSLSQMVTPPTTLKPDDIKRLRKVDCFWPSSVQIGDKVGNKVPYNIFKSSIKVLF